MTAANAPRGRVVCRTCGGRGVVGSPIGTDPEEVRSDDCRSCLPRDTEGQPTGEASLGHVPAGGPQRG